MVHPETLDTINGMAVWYKRLPHRHPLKTLFFLLFVLVLFLLFFVLFFLVLFVFLVVFVERVFILVFEFFRFLGNEIELDGMGLHDLEFHVTFRTAQDFALFDLVFIEIDFGFAIGAVGHSPLLLPSLIQFSRRLLLRVLYIATP
jgi:hypothetical protein